MSSIKHVGLNCGMTLSFVLEMNKGLLVSTGYTHTEFENHLSCSNLVQGSECRRVVDPVGLISVPSRLTASR